MSDLSDQSSERWTAGHHYHRDLADAEAAMASRMRSIDPDAAVDHDEQAAEYRRLSEKSLIWAREAADDYEAYGR